MHVQQHDTPSPFGFEAETVFFESAVGLRTNLDTWHPEAPTWVERLHVKAEAQWLHSGSTRDQLWIEAAPGVAVLQGRSTMRLHLPTAVAVAGDQRATVRRDAVWVCGESDGISAMGIGLILLEHLQVDLYFWVCQLFDI